MRRETRGKSQIRNPQSAICNQEAGDSLIEILAAVAIISIALVVFISALSTGAFGVRNTDRLTTATNLAANQLETIKAAPYNAAGAYPPVGASPGYTVTISSRVIVTGLQQVTVTIAYEGGALTVSNYRVNR
jgi:type II secretory pathway pseudopilin PulG